MFNTFKTLSLLIVLLTWSSCDEEVSHDPMVKVDQEAIGNFISFIDFSVEALRSNPPENPHLATAILIDRISQFEARRGIYLQLATSKASSAGREPVRDGNDGPSASTEQLASKIVTYCANAHSVNDYLSKLALLEKDVYSSRLGGVERSELLTRIALNKEFVLYLDRKVREITAGGAQVAPAMKCKGWWNCWGKCVAGTVGGAGLGALSGAAYGGAGCTMVLPVVGTVACGTAGAIAGGIFGGLVGASASC